MSATGVSQLQGGNTGNGQVALTYTADPVGCPNPVTPVMRQAAFVRGSVLVILLVFGIGMVGAGCAKSDTS